jgi:RNA polymerase sigma-70 factor (ECF subfamily)
MRALSSAVSDGSLIRASVSTPQAFATVFDRHAGPIWRYACRRVGPSGADEVVSETFSRAFTRRASYDGCHPDARPWLYGIATNVIREHARSEARHRRELEGRRELDFVDEELERVEARADAAAQVRTTAAALASLEAVDRETLLLYALTDLNYEQIATAMAAPVGTVRSRLSRARRLMRAQLGLAQATAGGASPVADEGRER